MAEAAMQHWAPDWDSDPALERNGKGDGDNDGNGGSEGVNGGKSVAPLLPTTTPEEALAGLIKALGKSCTEQGITGREKIQEVIDKYARQLTVDAIQGAMVTAKGSGRKGVLWDFSYNPPRRVHHCKKKGCTNPVPRAGRVCAAHGGFASLTKATLQPCRIPGCANTERAEGLCFKHGGRLSLGKTWYSKGPCKHEGCTNLAARRGFCARHGLKRRLCRVDGCVNQAQNGGVCKRHGAKVKRCVHEGCTRQVERGGYCVRHGALRGVCHAKQKKEEESGWQEGSKTGRGATEGGAMDGSATALYKEEGEEGSEMSGDEADDDPKA